MENLLFLGVPILKHIRVVSGLSAVSSLCTLGRQSVLSLALKKKINKLKDFKVICNGHTIERKKSVKYLAVILDHDLSRDSIVSSSIKKVNSRLKFLYRQ